jgi:hypothetical protein
MKRAGMRYVEHLKILKDTSARREMLAEELADYFSDGVRSLDSEAKLLAASDLAEEIMKLLKHESNGVGIGALTLIIALSFAHSMSERVADPEFSWEN